MKIFSRLYALVLTWARHPHAEYYLGFVSCIESSVFPIPPDTMLIPMTLAKRERAYRFALIATVSSVLGAFLGYAIGMFLFETVLPYFQAIGQDAYFKDVASWFAEWGFWVVLVAAVTPVPYKIFTISAGIFHLPLLPFFMASLVGRALRFYAVAGFFYYAGERVDAWFIRYIDIAGWLTVAVLVGIVFWFR